MLSVFVCLSSLRHVSPPESVSLHVVLTITSNDNSVTLPGSSTDWISSSQAKLSLTRSEWVRTCVRVYAHICLLPSITMLPWQPRLCVLCPLSLYRAAAGWNHLSDQGCPQAPPKHTESLNWKFTISSSLSPFNAGKLRVWSSSTPSFLWHLWTCHSRDSLVCLFCILAAVSSSGEAGTSLGPCAPLIPEKKEARWQREPRAINRRENSQKWPLANWRVTYVSYKERPSETVWHLNAADRGLSAQGDQLSVTFKVVCGYNLMCVCVFTDVFMVFAAFMLEYVHSVTVTSERTSHLKLKLNISILLTVLCEHI